MSKKILVTGFGPFGEHKINASWESVKLLPDNIEEYDVIKKEIPVSYDHVELTVPKLWENFEPYLVIHVGVSSYTNKLQIETQAFGTGYHRPDCNELVKSESSFAGKVCQEECLKTELNVKKFCSYINDLKGIEVQPSSDAGRYLCEFIYFTSLSINPKRTLFIHVPPLEKPYSAQKIADGLQEIIKCALIELNTCKEIEAQVQI